MSVKTERIEFLKVHLKDVMPSGVDYYVTSDVPGQIILHFDDVISSNVLLLLIFFCLKQDLKFFVTDDIICSVSFVINL